MGQAGGHSEKPGVRRLRFDVRLSRNAERYLRRLVLRRRQQVLAELDAIAENPFGGGTKALRGLGGLRASRVGPLRIVFAVNEDEGAVYVQDIGPRGDIYKDL